MNTGQYISAGGHFGFIAYAMFGGLFFTPSDNEPVQVQDVTMISEAEFAALSLPNTAPDVPEVAPEITAPEATPSESVPATPSEPAPVEPAPVVPAEPSAPTATEVTPPTPTPPNAQPSAPAPVQPPSDLPVAPEVTLEDPGAGLPDIASVRPTPRPARRIASEVVVNPEQTPEIATEVRPEVSDEAETPAPEPVPDEPAAAPPESVTEIVREADTPSGAFTSPRPKGRPASVVAAAQQAQEAKAAAAANAAQEAADKAEQDAAAQTASDAAADAAAKAAADAAAAIVAESVSDTVAAPDLPVGPPLTNGERGAMVVAVEQCWNTGSMSSEAQRTTVVVGFDMNPDGTPQNGSIRLVSSSGGTSESAEQAFQTARRAIIRCGAQGFPLPSEKFAQWQSIELNFDPNNMRFK